MIDSVDTPWSWSDARAELAELVEQLTPEQALAILKQLVAVEREAYVAPMLAGAVQGRAIWNGREGHPHGTNKAHRSEGG